MQTNPSKEIEAEAKQVKKLFIGATDAEDTLHQGLETLITSWVARFILNCTSSKQNQFLLN